MNAAQLLDFTFAGEPDIRDKQSPWSYFDSHLYLVHRPFISNLALPSSRLVGPVSTVALTDIVQLLLQKKWATRTIKGTPTSLYCSGASEYLAN